MKRRAIVTIVVTLAAGLTCRPMTNYPSAVGPRFTAALPAPATTFAADAPMPALRVVTLNLKYARRVERAIYAFQSYAPLRGADIIMLQEMDAPATQRIAAALGMAYVFYPAGVHPRTHRDFGNAILSRWPITADQKLLLPHLGRLRHGQRIATVASIQVGTQTIRLYCLHLGTPSDIGWAKRRDQARAVLADAAAYPLAIVAGDMNSHGIGKEFRDAGYLWPTEHDSFTTGVFNWDHIFLKGFSSPPEGAGVARDTLEISDHFPVWAIATP
ncbi:MAG TPA: endonuclease/exonuclease/phosphatase family protein [Gemmatimonadales bacterium]|jgi:endonuclease/exonuclease/phosphatase family metal-dependent hydrolase